MKQLSEITLLGFLIIFMAVGCTKRDSLIEIVEAIPTGYPVPTKNTLENSYPVLMNEEKQLSAFEAFQIAEAVALRWKPDAILYRIPATGIMEMNLGFPPIGSGWFFLFKGEKDDLEYYILVNNNDIAGITEAQPILVGEPPIKFIPLPSLEKMIDSDDVFEIFIQNSGDAKFKENTQTIINLQLEYLEANGLPMWTVFSLAQDGTITPLLHINAFTGEIVK